MKTKTLLSIATLLAAVSLTGCEKAKKAEEEVKEVAKEGVHKVEEAAKAVEEKVEHAAEVVEHKAEGVVEKVKAFVEGEKKEEAPAAPATTEAPKEEHPAAK